MTTSKEIYHSPDWYRSRASEDYTNPKVKHMLINDVGDNYDPKSIPEEIIDDYEELWNSKEFISEYAHRISEIEIEEMRLDNQALYKGLVMGYGTGEETYLKVVDEIARDLLLGSDKKLVLFKKRIRQEAQKPLQAKKRQKQLSKFFSTKGMKAVDEDERLFTWNNPIGDQKDYRKEIHYHLCITSLMSAIEERMKMLVIEEIKTIRTLQSRHTERMQEVGSLFIGDIDEGWVSKWLQIPIREQNNFVNEIGTKVDEIKKEMDSQQSNEDTIKIVSDVLNKTLGNSERLTGFE